MSFKIEIERKWLLSNLPKWPSHCEVKVIETIQSYHLMNGKFIRLRLELSDGQTTHLITYKQGGGIARLEWDARIPEWVYESLSENTSVVVHKTRYKVKFEDKIYEIDEFHGACSGLYLAELEVVAAVENNDIKSDEVNRQIVGLRGEILPDWLAITVIAEVTDDIRFSNQQIADYGIPFKRD